MALLADMAKQLRWLSKDSGVKWKRNGLRHSFISYRMAIRQNENQVATEAGNSPAMIFRHYRELVTRQQARAWFAIKPEGAAKNVIRLKGARTA